MISDNYLMKQCIKSFILHVSKKMKGDVLDIGCGQKPYEDLITGIDSVKSYTGVDIEGEYSKKCKPDILWDGNILPIDSRQYDTLVCFEVIEHVRDISNILKESQRVLRNSGTIIITSPFVWPLHDVPNDYFRYTPFSIDEIMNECNFTNIHTYRIGSWKSVIYQLHKLFLYRSSLSITDKLLLKPLLMFVDSYLRCRNIEKEIEIGNIEPMYLSLGVIANKS